MLFKLSSADRIPTQINPQRTADIAMDAPQIMETSNAIEASIPIQANKVTTTPSRTPHPAIEMGIS